MKCDQLKEKKKRMNTQNLFCDETYEMSTPKKGISEIPLLEQLETLNLLLQKEQQNTLNIRSDYIDSIQKDGMNEKWRSRLCNWMFDLGRHYNYPQDVIACAIHYMDKYLSTESVDKTSMQLLSITSLFIASKMHTSHPIQIDEIHILTQDTFSNKCVYQMEANITKKVNWNLNPSTSFSFARLFLNILEYGEKSDIWEYTMETLETIQQLYAFIGYQNSYIALTAIQMAFYEIAPTEENIRIIIDSVQIEKNNIIHFLQILLNMKTVQKKEHISYTTVFKSVTINEHISKMELLIMLLSS